jgi:hypothetical protein
VAKAAMVGFLLVPMRVVVVVAEPVVTQEQAAWAELVRQVLVQLAPAAVAVVVVDLMVTVTAAMVAALILLVKEQMVSEVRLVVAQVAMAARVSQHMAVAAEQVAAVAGLVSQLLVQFASSGAAEDPSHLMLLTHKSQLLDSVLHYDYIV